MITREQRYQANQIDTSPCYEELEPNKFPVESYPWTFETKAMDGWSQRHNGMDCRIVVEDLKRPHVEFEDGSASYVKSEEVVMVKQGAA